MITINSQPAADLLMAAYRPIMVRAAFSNNSVAQSFDITVASGAATFYAADITPFFQPGSHTITFSNAGAINVTRTINVVSTSGGNIVTIGVTGGTLTDGHYPGAHIAVDGVLLLDTTLSGAPKAVYCDIYINGIYYKSQSKTQPVSTGVGTADFEFDLQDAAQEYIEKYLPPNGNPAPQTDALNVMSFKLRSSSFSSDNFIVPDTPVPVQGTGNTAPVSGGGTAGNNFFIVNAALQHEDNQNLEAHLNTFKSGTWATNVFPLSHRPTDKYRICRGDSDYFPIVNKGNDIDCLRLYYRNKGATSFAIESTCADPPPIGDFRFRWEREAGDAVDLAFSLGGTVTSVDWGDGAVTSGMTHTYSSPGLYLVTVTGSTTVVVKFLDSNVAPGIADGRWNITELLNYPNYDLESVEINPNTLTVDQITSLPSLIGQAALLFLVNYSQQLTELADVSDSPLLREYNYGWTNAGVTDTSLDLSNNPLLEKVIVVAPLLTSINCTFENVNQVEILGALDTSAINTILQALDANGISNPPGFPCLIQLLQTPAAPPSGAGITAKLNLIAKGWSVNTD